MGFFNKLGFGPKNNTSPSDDLAHINQEMYKKGVELNERNKTLSLLQKIDQIILGSITHPEEIGKQVTSLLVKEADVPLVCIYLYSEKEKMLTRLAFSEVGQEDGNIPSEKPFLRQIPLFLVDNILVQAINERTVKVSPDLVNVLVPQDLVSQAQQIQAAMEIKSNFVYPLIVRNELIGAMVVSLKQEEQNVSEYLKDLLGRLTQVIGIAIDSALLYNEVQMSNEKLKTLDKLKDEFVSLASHELRTPMTAIKSYLWMALDGRGGPLTEKQTYYIQRAYLSTDRLIKLVNDMLNISRIESGRISVVMKAVDLERLIEEVIEEVMPRANEVGVTIEKIHADALPQVFADSDKIKEIIFNLIGNSIKFTPKGGKVTVSFARNGDMVETKIQDTGSGIDADDLPKLFQKFGLIEGSYTTNQAASGTGLGLYICKAIVELHKGKIWASSEGRGKGAEFAFSLKVFDEAEQKEFDAHNSTPTPALGLIRTQV